MSNRCTPVGVLVCLFAGAAACSGVSPTQPAPAVPGVEARDSAAAETVLLLAAGSVTLTSQKGTISGTYTGEAAGLGIAEQGSTTVALTGGTGLYSGASGTLTGAGSGGFTGEGQFSLVLKGTIATASGARQVRVSLRGTSTVSCRGETIVVTQTGAGTGTSIGRISAVLTHDVASNAGCSSD